METSTPENNNAPASRTDKAVVCDALVSRLGDNEVSRIELRLPKCHRCGAPAEMRTASWTWIDYVCCSKRCGVTTYRNLSSGHYDGMTHDEAWEDNLAEWMRLSANAADQRRPTADTKPNL